MYTLKNLLHGELSKLVNVQVYSVNFVCTPANPRALCNVVAMDVRCCVHQGDVNFQESHFFMAI